MPTGKAPNPLAWINSLLLKLKLDPYIMAIMAFVVLASLFPVSGAAAAALALIRFKRPVVQVIAACALIGWGLSLGA